MSTEHLLAVAWEIDPSIVTGGAALLVAYLVAVRFRRAVTTAYFTAGVLTMVLDLIGPLDVLGDSYLFSAHMLEHLLLILAVPPLLILGLPARTVSAVLRWRPARRIEGVLRRPVVAWTVGIGTLWVWHLPLLYNATLASERIHIAEHLSFLVTATVFWWPVLAPLRHHRLGISAALAYLISAAIGVLLTVAPLGLYPAYLHPVDELGALSLIRSGWGLDAAADQQLGGVLMWVLGMFVFLWAILGVLARWYRGEHNSGRVGDQAAIANGRGAAVRAGGA
jgi:putative membrane protein